MDEDQTGQEERAEPDTSENTKEEHLRASFAPLRAMLQRHSYPVKGHRSKISQSAAALSLQMKGKVNRKASREKFNWIPSFHSYENFNRMTLQSLDGFMIIVSTDGVIIYVAENISSLLGLLPNDIVGKELLSLVPEEEKAEVFRKIALKVPVSSSEPSVLVRSVFLSWSCESPDTGLPLEDQFYMVGMVCIIRAQTLWDLFAVKESTEDAMLIQDPDEEQPSVHHRSIQGRRSSRKEFLHAESDASSSEDQADDIAVEQYEPQESYAPYDSSTSSSEIIPESPETSSLQIFDLEPDVGYVAYTDEVEQVEQMGEMEELEQVDEEEEVDEVYQEVREAQEHEEDQVDQEDQVQQEVRETQEHKEDQVDQEDQVQQEVREAQEHEEDQVDQEDQVQQDTLSHSSVPADVRDQSLPVPPSIISYINSKEMELMKKFREQLEETTQMLQAEIQNQGNELKMLKEKFQAMQDSKSQSLPVPPSIISYINSKEMELMKKFREQLEETTQMLQAEIQNQGNELKMLKEKFQAMQDSKSQMQPSTSRRIRSSEPQSLEPVPKKPRIEPAQEQMPHLPQQEQPPAPLGLFMPLCDDTLIFIPTEPTMISVEQPSGYDRDDKLGGQEDKAHSFLPEDQQQPCVRLWRVVEHPSHSPRLEAVSSTNFCQASLPTESNLVTLETPQDYLQLWQQPQDPQHHICLQVNTWPSSEQVTLQNQVTWTQAPAVKQEPEALQF